MRIKLAYGKQGLWIRPPATDVDVIEPAFVPGIPDGPSAIAQALRHPIGSPALKELVRAQDEVAIVFSDITRPTPNHVILPVLLGELAYVPRENIVLINATGMHRANTPEELRTMLGPGIVENYRIVTHDALDPSTLTWLGTSSFGTPIWVNSTYLRARVKILTGFIEPHFFAGFSGGPKAVLPGVCGEATVLGNHSARMIGHPRATWGVLDDNPIHQEIREVAGLTRPAFIVNVALNKDKQITGVFAGDVSKAHESGAHFVRDTAMQPVAGHYDVVITTNGGYPLDINLYQTVKGMSAAAQIVKPAGSIIAVSECREGIPEHGNYRRILQMARTPEELLRLITRPGFAMFDQWEAQLQALIQAKANVYVYSDGLTEEQIRQAMLLPCRDIEGTLAELLRLHGPRARVCVLPEGPQTIPFVAGNA
ncbi:MAG: nickel-dependent lactate racemase [Chloroflexota bacterium]